MGAESRHQLFGRRFHLGSLNITVLIIIDPKFGTLYVRLVSKTVRLARPGTLSIVLHRIEEGTQ